MTYRTYRHFAIHPRHHRPPARAARRLVPPACVGALAAAICIAVHVLLPGYALVARVRIEVVPAARAPAASGPTLCGAALCGTAVIRG